MERFWSKTSLGETGCMEWTGSRFRTGYGRFRLKGRTQSAHRVAYELSVGPIPDGMLICHRCDNPPCVNPDHLFVGTKSDNAADMIRKGRHWIVTDPSRRRTGADAHRATLTVDAVRTVFVLRREGLSQRAIAKSVGTTQGHVSRILNGKTWPEVTGVVAGVSP